jgi:hypothetical protein
MFRANYTVVGTTVELGELLDSGFKLWDFDFPAPRSEIEYNGKRCVVDFNRDRLIQKINNHYRFREIGQETPARFKHYLKTRLNEIMPYYVQLYEFDAKFRNIEDPLESYNLLETFTEDIRNAGSVTGNTSGESSGVTNGTKNSTKNGSSLDKFSNTPQGSIENLEHYLTEARNILTDETASETANESNTGSVSGSSSETSEGTTATTRSIQRKGNIGVQPLGGEVQNIRSAFINIDLMIVEELNNLFIGIY